MNVGLLSSFMIFLVVSKIPVISANIGFTAGQIHHKYRDTNYLPAKGRQASKRLSKVSFLLNGQNKKHKNYEQGRKKQACKCNAQALFNNASSA